MKRCLLETVSGRVRLDVPPILFGYKLGGGGEQEVRLARGAEADISQMAAQSNSSYLEVYITLQPPIALPEKPTLHVCFFACMLVRMLAALH